MLFFLIIAMSGNFSVQQATLPLFASTLNPNASETSRGRMDEQCGRKDLALPADLQIL
jgi:hypothetical protein